MFRQAQHLQHRLYMLQTRCPCLLSTLGAEASRLFRGRSQNVGRWWRVKNHKIKISEVKTESEREPTSCIQTPVPSSWWALHNYIFSAATSCSRRPGPLTGAWSQRCSPLFYGSAKQHVWKKVMIREIQQIEIKCSRVEM